MQLDRLPSTSVITTATREPRAWLSFTAENRTGDFVPTVKAGMLTGCTMFTAVVIWMLAIPLPASLTVKSIRLVAPATIE